MKTKLLFLIFLFSVNISYAGWTAVNMGTSNTFTGISMPNNQIFYLTAMNPATWQGYLYKSTNGGTNWSSVPYPPNIGAAMGCSFAPDGLNGILWSTAIVGTGDGGAMWMPLYVPSDTVIFFACDIRGNAVNSCWAVGMKVTGSSFSSPVVIRCSNLMAASPYFVRLSLPQSMAAYQLTSVSAVDSTTCYIGVNGHPAFDGILKTTDKGATWQQQSTVMEVWGITMQSSGTGYAAAGGTSVASVFKTINGGTTWNSVYTNASNGLNAIMQNNGVYAAGTNGLIIRSTDGGASWSTQSSGTSSELKFIASLNTNSNIIFAGGEDGALLKTTDGGVGVNNISSSVPDKNYLYRNYPNPFNPNTIIKFDLKKSSYVTMKIYDSMGREVETIVNEKLDAGTFSASWNGANFSSGVYFYKIAAENFSETRKMMLVK